MVNKLDYLQKLELQLLDKFIEVCDKYNLQWFADSGTLLGAVRHKGFIPWDDDIDVIMPRKDYNKLLLVAKDEFTSPYFFQTPETDNVWCLHPRLRLDNTTFILNWEQNGHQHKGIFIDIFVLDVIPEDKTILNYEIGFLKTLGKFTNIMSTGQINETTIIDRKQAFNVMNNVIEELGTIHSNSKLCANAILFRVTGCENDIRHRSSYAAYIEENFEGLKHKIRIPIGYNEILTNLYGDNWQTPKEVPAMHTSFVDCYNSYKNYEDIPFDVLKEKYEEQF